VVGMSECDGSFVKTTRIAAGRAYAEAGIRYPRREISLTEVHDCFSITEIVTLEDLGLANDGEGWRDMLDGRFDADGALPCQTDGGLKCFGHPIGASGLRMIYEGYLQLQGRAGPRQLADPVRCLSHNLGGQPAQNVSSVCIIGRLDAR
jgi:acetyl-CoA C-acetyltransferase